MTAPACWARLLGSSDKASERLASSSAGGHLVLKASFGREAGMKQAIVAVLILLSWTGSAKAWSEDGHRIVCAIAWKELAPETRAVVEGLLKEDSASGFAEACLWADAIRSDAAYDWTKPHHYVNVPQGAASIDLARDCPPEIGCIIRAITMHIGTLRHPKASAADRAQALKFLAHFIGDIHQPLHAGRAEDRGGTAIKVRFLGEETSLHAVWDGGLIAGMGLDWRALADRLSGRRMIYDGAGVIPSDQRIALITFRDEMPASTLLC